MSVKNGEADYLRIRYQFELHQQNLSSIDSFSSNTKMNILMVLQLVIKRFLKMGTLEIPQNGFACCHFMTMVKCNYLFQKLVSCVDPTTTIFLGAL